MISDIEARRIGCVITKALSKLRRNYIESGGYMEVFFTKHNVRYIAVTDNYDSLNKIVLIILHCHICTTFYCI